MNEDEGRRTPHMRALQAAAETDREDLLAILTMRFGPVPDDVREQIEACHDLSTLERLILVAANVPDWSVFLDELTARGDEFKVVGGRFDPLSSARASSRESQAHGKAEPHPETHLIQIQRPKEN